MVMSPQKEQLSSSTSIAKRSYQPAVISARHALAGNVSRRLRMARILLDATSITVAHLIALSLTRSVPGRHSALYIATSVISGGAMLGLMTTSRLYDEDTLFPGGDEFSRLCKALVQTAIAVPVLAFLTKVASLSRIWLVLVLTLSALLVSTGRLIVRQVLSRQRRKGLFRRPVIAVGKNGVEAHQSDVLSNEFEVLGAFDVDGAEQFLTDLVDDPENPKPRSLSVMVSGSGLSDDELWRIMLKAGQAGCPVYLRSRLRSVSLDRLTVRPLSGETVMRVSPPALTGFQAFRKRVFDLSISGSALLLLAPILAAIAVAVMITSGRPIFYGQERVGRNGKAFTIWKFRTMRNNAEASSGPVWAQEGDPRRTKLGSALRAMSIDELPQLWNVLKGEMSLVGPRPERPFFVNEFVETIPWYPYRHRMRPGITGWAQAHGLRGNTSLEERVLFDNWYIEHWSLALDLKIILLTFAEIFRGEHAY